MKSSLNRFIGSGRNKKLIEILDAIKQKVDNFETRMNAIEELGKELNQKL